MGRSIIQTFLDFKIKKLRECCQILLSDHTSDDFFDQVLTRYLENYKNVRYFHVLETLEEDQVVRYGYETIEKEFLGIEAELLYRLDMAEVLDDMDTYQKKRKWIEECREICLLAALLDMNDFSDCYPLGDIKAEVEAILYLNPRFLLPDVSEFSNQLALIIEDKLKKERKFRVDIQSDHFCLDYHLYSQKPGYYEVDLAYSIKKLAKTYKKTLVDKVLHSDQVALGRVSTIFSLLNVELLSKIEENRQLEYYFVYLDPILFKNKSEWEGLLEKIDNPLFKKHVILVVDYSTYFSHKAMFEDNKKGYTFAVFVNMSRIKDVDKKMSQLESIPVFDYIILDQVKDKDNDYFDHYSSTKELVMNVFEV